MVVMRRFHTRPYAVLLVIYLAGLLVFIGLTLLFALRHPQQQNPKPYTVSCSGSKQQTVQLHIQNNAFVPKTLTAHTCDRLLITNDDQAIREIAFGPHDHHINYPGFGLGRVLGPDQQLSITLLLPGNFEIHDHLNDNVQMRIIIK